MPLKSLFDNGFFINNVSDGYENNLAAYSLQSSLECYAKTADDLDYLYHNIYSTGQSPTQEEQDKYHGTSYAVNACNAIIHFQHFLELFIKDILLGINHLLVYNPLRKPTILYKMIKGEPVSNEELEGVNFIEFSEALTRIKALHQTGNLDASYNFLSNYFEVFERINTLRNRIAHRGVFIIRHQALDEIYGRYILPFIKDLSDNDPKYRKSLNWRLNINNPNLNPLESIIDEYKKPSPNPLVVYVCKLIADAGFHNPLNYSIAPFFKSFLTQKIQKAELMAGELAKIDMFDIKECPICGCKTFIERTDNADEEDDMGNIINACTFVYSMECHQCGFHINNWLIDKIENLDLSLPTYYWCHKH